MTQIQTVLAKYAEVTSAGNGYVSPPIKPKYASYAVSTLRGGVGKSTLTFNLGYELSRVMPVLMTDLCPQCNLTETMMGEAEYETTIHQGLMPAVLGPAFGDVPSDMPYKASKYCEEFKGGKGCFFIPGDSELFAFPSSLYQQLQMAASRPGENRESVRKLLQSLKSLLEKEAKDYDCTLTLMDTSPFYAGGTHLAWCAADAVIIPVRVDAHSLKSLELTLDLLSNPARDFQFWNSKGGNLKAPRVAAIVMTMAGSRSNKALTPDSASTMYIERALALANKYHSLFDHDKVTDAIVVSDDFVSSGRISGVKSIPIAKLKANQFHTVDGGKRLQVNVSVDRYKRQLAYLAATI